MVNEMSKEELKELKEMGYQCEEEFLECHPSNYTKSLLSLYLEAVPQSDSVMVI